MDRKPPGPAHEPPRARIFRTRPNTRKEKLTHACSRSRRSWCACPLPDGPKPHRSAASSFRAGAAPRHHKTSQAAGLGLNHRGCRRPHAAAAAAAAAGAPSASSRRPDFFGGGDGAKNALASSVAGNFASPTAHCAAKLL